MLLVEHKSLGKDLGKAESQAFRYIQRPGQRRPTRRSPPLRDRLRFRPHRPARSGAGRAATTAAVRRFRVETIEFPLAELHRHIHDFAFIPGYKQHRFEDQDPINLQAVEIMGDLHDALEAGGYTGHELERFLVRVLFCLFAEDTGIFEREAFRLYHRGPHASPTAPTWACTWRGSSTCSTRPPEKRQKNLDETLAAFPYVNGELFAEQLGFADFNRDMRNSLLACTRFDWSRISPAIFGSLFQGVMEPQRAPADRRPLHQRARHPQSHPLAVPRRAARRVRAHQGQREANCKQFHQKLAGLRFLDPACGCGNFLVITYRELRLLEIEVLQAPARRAATAARHPATFRWWTWTPSTASRSASGPRASPKWPCG